MLQVIILLLGGALLLYVGGEFLVRGGSRMARLLGISPMVAGLTVVAFGTSLPELVVSLVAALEGREAIAVGNVIGSNIANVGLIVGLSAIVFHVAVSGKRFLRDMNIMLGVTVLFGVMLLDGYVARWEGLALFVGIIAYTYYRIVAGKGDSASSGKPGTVPANLALLVFGTLGLAFGAKMFVDGASQLARTLGVAELVIGLTVVAYGTSLPELATSLVAAFRRESDISIGNIIGSNLFNMMGVIGLVSLVSPLTVDREVFTFELPIMIAFSLALYPVLVMKKRISKLYALALFLGYVTFLITLFTR
ncbi:MAG: calcium/sodium antiporter [Candidatus Neomarinimicrobiota bacterium]